MLDRTREITVIFIDYSDLLDSIIDRTSHPDHAHHEAVELILATVKKYQAEPRLGTNLVAYADFSEFVGQAGEVEQLLYSHGVTPRFVSCRHQATAAEVQLTAEAVDMLHRRPDVRGFVLITGQRAYWPLLQMMRSQGRKARLVMYDAEGIATRQPALAGVVEEASDLLAGAARPAMKTAVANGSRSPERRAETPAPERPEPVSYDAVTDPVCMDALELIIDFFGQYEEIYLTPLLRKMSEHMSVEDYDPKAIISELEDAGAVWLEKRAGVPYDYTVLILDDEHPDVERLRLEPGGRFRENGQSAFVEIGHR